MATKMKLTNQVLCTGSSGFIGTHLMKKLAYRGVPYDIANHEKQNILDAGVLKKLILMEKPSVIVHLAAISNIDDVNKDPEQALKTNIIGTFNVLRIAHEYGIKVILASSASVVQSELTLYAQTKECMENLAKMFPNVITARFYNIYGPGSKSVVNKFTERIAKGLPIELYGNTTRDYVYIDDLVDAIMTMINTPEFNSYVEVGTGRSISLNKLVSLIEGIVGKKAHMQKLPEKREIQESECKITSYGFYKTTIEQGIKKLWQN